ncbi:cysteine--tRNA ligase [Methanocella sp. CWC-04]|uniref:Cysteine--tRNA ligase n=1 Tax=Methanooceanicella nereidis TaxID=2052831 RepID=A0AAP2RDV4_9EURY|nr:cysteine--tRNA ligase [Methanocella sp. CWC-04]MCD1295816.1 cysteine--tRNA ligase [Methanocella sp. CWC-04]
MALRFYNTLTSSVEEFVPLDGKNVKMYVCGPTVYDNCHMGHARSYIVFDVIRRYLKHKGYNVIYVQNFTDIDDKIIKRANELGADPLNLSKKFIQAYFEDMDKLNVMRADQHPKVSDHIGEIIKMIEKLIDHGNAYVSDGSVYFSIDSMKSEIGVLSHQSYDALKVGARLEVDERKRNPMDFVLWKASKPGEMIAWDSPWGKGRPGWHIECSAMAIKLLGEKIDIHGGGMDLIFPHHESEIMQSEAYTNKPPFAKYWIHNGFLTINKEKMSKSLGNFFTIKEVLNKFSPETIRFFVLFTHYQSPLDFSDMGLEEAKRSLYRIQNTLSEIDNRIAKPRPEMALISADEVSGRLKESLEKFESAMNDNFNTREAIAEMFDFTRDVNRWLSSGDMPVERWEKIKDLYTTYSEILGIRWTVVSEDVMTTELLKLIVDIREEVRKKKDFETSDLIRNRLKELGILLEDSKEGVKIKRIES